MAWMMGQARPALNKLSSQLRAIWQPTIIISLLAYALVLHYVVLGIPGIPYQYLSEHYFWKEAAIEVEKIAEEIQSQTGEIPIVVGMSKWSIASALSFYNKNNVPLDIRSRNTFGESGAMYDFWFPSQPPTDRPLILVGMKRDVLERNRAGNEIDLMLHEPSPIHYKVVTRNGTPLRCLYAVRHRISW